MVRTSKSATTETKASRSKKESVPAPTPTPAPDVAPVVEVAAPTETYTDKMIEFNAKLQQLGSIFTTIKSDFKTLQKSVERDIKAAVKAATARKKRDMGDRPKSGFVKPTRISDELAIFLNKEIGTEMARTDVTREINFYIKEHKLQDVNNGRKIIPDKKLNALLNVKKGEELTYFNLQRYMSPHFAKAGSTVNA